MMENYFQLAVSLLIATLILLIIFKFTSSTKKENSLDSKRKGKTVLITGSSKSGKTLLFEKILDAPILLETVHSLKANISSFGQWKLVDLPLDEQKLHSQPADYFHYNDLAALILCFNQNDSDKIDLIVSMTVAVGILKHVPLGVLSSIPKDSLQYSLIKTFNNLQNSRLSSLLSSTESAISFDDPINRLVFESVEGEVAADYESKVREYFDEKVTICESSDLIKEWIQSNL